METTSFHHACGNSESELRKKLALLKKEIRDTLQAKSNVSNIDSRLKQTHSE